MTDQKMPVFGKDKIMHAFGQKACVRLVNVSLFLTCDTLAVFTRASTRRSVHLALFVD